jgi:hypothetical protein
VSSGEIDFIIFFMFRRDERKKKRKECKITVAQCAEKGGDGDREELCEILIVP